MEKVECIVVGAGSSGSACALSLARRGIETVLVERGANPGDKTVSSFVMFDYVLKDLVPDYEKHAPLERACTGEVLTSLSNYDYMDIRIMFDERYQGSPGGYTCYRSKFENWFADQAEKEGAELVRGMCVTGLIKENGKVAGIRIGDEELRANVVIGADGFHSVVSREAGLYDDSDTSRCCLCIKEVIDLPTETINDRFNIRDNEALVIEGIGYPLSDAGGFFTIYPMTDAVTLVLACPMQAIIEKGVVLRERMEDFKKHPYVKSYIRGGKLREYSSHIMPDGGRMKIDKTYDDGVLLCGTAGGYASNTWIGVPPGMLTGVKAAETVEYAKKKGKYDRATLSHYKDLLFETGIPRMQVSAKSFSNFFSGPVANHMEDFMGNFHLAVKEVLDDEIDFTSPNTWPILEKGYEFFFEPYLPKFINVPAKPMVKLTETAYNKFKAYRIRRKA